MEKRMEKFEQDNKNLDHQKRKKDDITKESVEKIVEIQPMGSSYSDALKKNDQPAEQVYRSTWARKMSQISLETQLKMVTKAATRLEGDNGDNESEFRRQERSKKKKLEFGDSAELHDMAEPPGMPPSKTGIGWRTEPPGTLRRK